MEMNPASCVLETVFCSNNPCHNFLGQRSRAFNREDFWLGTPRVMSVAGNRGDGSTSKYYTPLDSTSLSTPSSESESLRMGRRKKRRKPRSIRSAEVRKRL